MTSKEAIEELKTVLLTNKGTEKYADIFIENLIIPIEKDLEVLEILKPFVLAQKLYLKYNIVCNKDCEDILENKIIKEWLENDK